MKKLIFTLLLAFFGLSVNAQTVGTISTTIGDYFVKGVSPVSNTITASEPSSQWIDFYLYDSNGNPLDSSIDNTGGNTRSWTYDMGILDTGNYFVAYFYDASINYLGYNFYQPNIDLPNWIGGTFNGTASVQSINLNTVTVDCSLPITALLLNQSVPSMKGIGGKAFDMSTGTLDFTADFDMGNNISTTSPAQINFLMNTLGISNTYNNGSTNFTSTISLDTNFNMVFNGTAIWQPNPITKSFEMNNAPLLGFSVGNLISGGGLCVSTNLGFELQPKVKGQIVLGYDGITQQWGFIQSGSDVTQILGKVTATASAQGTLKTACVSVFGKSFGIGTIARGKVEAALTVGGGISYTSASGTTPYWGGDFSLYAEGEIAGFGSRSGTYGPNTWGNLPVFKQIGNYTDDFFNFSANTIQINSNIIPQAWPMGVMSGRDSLLSVVWMDDINFVPGKRLLLTYYNPFTNTFTYPTTIAYNDSAIETPSTALMPSHRSLITWSQLQYPTSQIDTVTGTIDDLVKDQEIWFAIYDDVSQQVVYRDKLTDSNGDRPDGTPKIHWGTGNKGIITWQVGDLINTGSDIYFTEVTENGNNYTFTSPTALAGLSGYNYDIHISYYDNSNAIAEWINDSDMNDSTTNEVMISYWDGSSWTVPTQLYTIANGTRIKEITLATNGNYGLEGVTYEYYDINETLVNGIYLGWWNSSNPSSYQTITEEDSTYVFQIPRAAVSKNGIASFVLQIRDLLLIDDQGEIDLFMKDLNSAVNWQNMSYSPYVSDQDEFVWDMSAAFGYLQSSNSNDILYLFTQEMDTLGSTNPSYGQIFGHPDLNLVLRALKATSSSGNISLSDVAEPNDTLVTAFYQEIKPFNYNFDMKQNHPNPFSHQTVIPFHISKQGKTTIDLYDMMGQHIATILNQELQPGDYQTLFDSGNLVSGFYFYVMRVNNSSVSRKMIIAK